ncbi:RpiB/LacA/LacB family sugar-phosphate isomerase [Moellerella wisconsensis]|uniref:Ribose 5-phosphate isomerase B n=1 Tax=Moellerella wisconsensis ATCC 35017 TaxID=1354267 RepID=A0A0N0Z9W5_9GAMM|nr:RpiB/LacA/LacB family sugar-phosphate isomerase [Moellerella wisconsensis]KPD02606.1 ribose 5-phosphate isomerase B [Moellerella wisconsensis ATCC 35017]VFS48128.1 Ribose-5-phosphate isomerase B [Moellerella wisconsensis]
MAGKKIIIGADPSGFDLKNTVKSYLCEKGYHVDDITAEAPTGYCDVGDTVGKKISDKEYDLGFIFCGTGMGVSIAANKHFGVYCGVCESVTTAKLCKAINNCNVLSMGGLLITPFKAKMMVDAFLGAEFSQNFSEATPDELKSGYSDIQKAEKRIFNR